MKPEKVIEAAERLNEVKQLLLEAGVAPNGRFVHQIDELHLSLDLFARLIPRQVA
jgi:hypothetical protein